ncbi:unnamed protein product [Schistosoma rodhaini]|uniref:Uncharacterized protein n=1 Tax=Schistosoma rodhaini TaxID=6188 RepID=A0AA85GI88_9TREM|nr:unnamed protein product [Schistosoma rodhaini]
MFNNEEMVSSSSSSYLPLWAWYYLYITGIIFLCTLCILCYLQKWLCFKIIIRKQWCNKNAIDMDTNLIEYTNNNHSIMQ